MCVKHLYDGCLDKSSLVNVIVRPRLDSVTDRGIVQRGLNSTHPTVPARYECIALLFYVSPGRPIYLVACRYWVKKERR